MLLALRYYGRELARLHRPTAPAIPLFALGGIGLDYIAPLIVAKLAGDIADGTELTVGSALPYVMDALVDLPPMVIADLLGIHPKTARTLGHPRRRELVRILGSATDRPVGLGS
ncbi:hypothetical protein [Streptomyces canus]|uniref:hypothetical protein n=1 Tax=Streptomyces canus TaxID=58343 RepID=UPI002DDA3172|nr:hypothetical protein [Streptomyces canus]